MKLSAIFLALPKQLSSSAQPSLQGLLGLLDLCLSIFGIHLTSSMHTISQTSSKFAQHLLPLKN